MSDQLFVATRKGLFTVRQDSGRQATWQITGRQFAGDNVSIAITDPRDGHCYAALDHGHFGVKLHRAPAPQGPWEEVATPTYPQKPDGEVDLDQWGREIPSTTVRIWALEPGGAEQPGVLWCGTIPGGLFRTDDRGSTWTLAHTLWNHPKRKEWFGGGADYPGIHSICINPQDRKELRIAISCGGVWRSCDGGDTWDCYGEGMWNAYMPPEQKYNPNIQDVHCLVQCAGAPDHLWVQHHNGIFRSTDGGQHWHEIETVSPSSFGFAVAVHPEDPLTAWFVPAESDQRRIPADGRMVVSRTRDGGQSFEELHQGLPQVDAYDLVFRHALDVDHHGRRLAIGSTTGNLWISEDQGDSWICVSNHLPPIHAVRFI